MIKVEHISKKFGKLVVLKDVSFNIESSHVLGVIGANGSGKTTLLKLILGLISPDKGSIIIQSKSPFEDISFVSEEGGLMRDMQVQSYLKYFCLLQGIALNNVTNALSYFKLEKIRNTKIKKLSNGQRKKVDITQALLSNPKLLIMDEPTNGLDFHSIVDLREFVKDYSKNGGTVIITSHNLTVLEKVCDKFLFLDDGLVKGWYSKDEVQKDFVNLEHAYEIHIKSPIL